MDFTCNFSATLIERKGATPKRIVKRIKVRAADSYQAVDAVVAKLGAAYDKMFNPVFRFGRTRTKMSAQLAAVLDGAGPEEQ